MKTSNNLNQLLSRVKTIFGHKAHSEEKQTELTTQQRSVSDQRLKAALAEVEKYLDDNFGTEPSAMTYQEYSNGITLTSDDPTSSTAVVILTRTNGTLNLPDNVNYWATSIPTKAMTTSSSTSETSSSSSKDLGSNTASNTSP